MYNFSQPNVRYSGFTYEVDASCGNGVYEPLLGEECDDANTIDGDCCTYNCLFEDLPGCEPPTTTTTTTTSTTTTTTSTTSTSTTTTTLPGCGVAPRMDCVSAAKAKLLVVEKKPGKEKFKAGLGALQADLEAVDFGDPVAGTTRVDTCVYDAAGALVASMTVDRAGADCDGKACWKAKGSKGYLYKDKAAAADGMALLLTKSGASGTGKIVLKGGNNAGKGQSSLPTGTTTALSGNAMATIQVLTDDASCFTASITTVAKADATLFKGKAP